MCGICGIVERQGPIDHQALKRMTAAIQHRGPDDEGFYIAPEESQTGVGLGFRRLSIIDLVTGNQPISNEDGSVHVVFNGEIYNYRELRAGLESEGTGSQPSSDTEVIVHLYEELGPQCVERLNGMFAHCDVGRAPRRAHARARSVRQEAALLRRPRRELPLRVRAEVAA